MEKVCAYVLTGGKPEEFEPLTLVRNKAALPAFGMYRIIDFVLSNLMNSEIDNVGVITQYLPGSLMEHIGIGIPWDFVGYGRTCRVLPPFFDKISMQWYENPFDGIKKNLFFARMTKAEDILILSGENIYKMDYRPLVDYHRLNKADITVVVKKFKAEEIEKRLGLVDFNNEGKVISFIEKPEQVTRDGFASLGIYVLSSRAFYDIFEILDFTGSKESAGKRILDKIRKYETYAYITNEEWYYIRNMEEYFDMNFRFMDSLRVAELDMWNVRTSLEDRNTGFRPASVIGSRSEISNAFIPKGCRIYGEVTNVIFSPGVIVEPGTVVQNSIIFHDTVIKSGAVIKNAIIDKDVVINEKAKVGDEQNLTIIGKGCVIKKGSVIKGGSRILPMETVE